MTGGELCQDEMQYKYIEHHVVSMFGSISDLEEERCEHRR